jgi:hypothetical protein
VTGDVRGVPDVASFASQFPGVAQAIDFGSGVQWYGASGTSFAAPLVASGVALVNAELVSRGLPRIGMPTPLLYLIAADGPDASVRDVVEGTNDVNGRGCCTAGPGYDLTTGVGSLRFDALADAAARYGPPLPPPPSSTLAPAVDHSTPAAVSAPPATLPATGIGDPETGVGLSGLVLVIVGLLLVAISARRSPDRAVSNSSGSEARDR